MIRRILASLVIVWLLGFAWFAAFLPQPVEGMKTDVVVVATGGEGRIARGLEVLRAGNADSLLVSGVDEDVRGNEFAVEYDVTVPEMLCCITLGYKAVDTLGNATETAEWVSERKATSIRLVTTDWHMRRAALDLARELPDDIAIIRDAVPSEPRFGTLFREYNKLVLDFLFGRWVA